VGYMIDSSRRRENGDHRIRLVGKSGQRVSFFYGGGRGAVGKGMSSRASVCLVSEANLFSTQVGFKKGLPYRKGANISEAYILSLIGDLLDGQRKREEES